MLLHFEPVVLGKNQAFGIFKKSVVTLRHCSDDKQLPQGSGGADSSV